jgi:hypothetical protein
MVQAYRDNTEPALSLIQIEVVNSTFQYDWVRRAGRRGDELDCIGLREYEPRPDDFSTASIVKTVEAVPARFGRPVIFTAVGFAALAQSHG